MRTRIARCVPCSSWRAMRWLAACGLLGLLQVTAVPLGAASEARRTAIVQAAENARDSVVNIHGQKMMSGDEDPLARGEAPHKVNGMGTGIVIDERGYIIANFHVVDGVTKIEVTLSDETSYVAQ